MNKKLFSVVLALVLMVFAVSAFAVPSKTTADLVTISSVVETSTGAPVAEDFKVGVVKSDANVDKEFASIAAFVADGGAVADYFDSSVISQIANVAPGLDISNLEMNEFFAFEVGNYDPAYGDMSFTFAAAADYEPGQEIVVLVGVYGDDGVEWYPLAATVNDSRQVEVTFTEEVLESMGNSPVALAFLS